MSTLLVFVMSFMPVVGQSAPLATVRAGSLAASTLACVSQTSPLSHDRKSTQVSGHPQKPLCAKVTAVAKKSAQRPLWPVWRTETSAASPSSGRSPEDRWVPEPIPHPQHMVWGYSAMSTGR